VNGRRKTPFGDRARQAEYQANAKTNIGLQLGAIVSPLMANSEDCQDFEPEFASRSSSL
jgi:hypothetical protein